MTYKCYRNLDPKYPEAWSVEASGNKPVRVACLVAYDITEGGLTSVQFERCVAGKGPRKVFAWYRAQRIRISAVDSVSTASMRRVFFNPKTGDRFFHTADGARVHSAPRAVFTADGAMYID
jgi:hypothetical protein